MAKVTISFVTSENDSSIRIESDSERNVDYTGKTKTKFKYGDTAYFRVYAAELSAVSVSASDGDINDLGFYYETVTGEAVPFITDQTAELEKTATALVSYKWLGNTLGTITLYDVNKIKAEITPTGSNIAVASVTYRAPYRLFGLTLSTRDMSEYPVLVYVESSNV